MFLPWKGKSNSCYFQIHFEVVQAALLRDPGPLAERLQVVVGHVARRRRRQPQGLRGHAGDQPRAEEVPDQAGDALRRGDERNVAEVR